ncbi:MAG: aldose 1-epimerase [Planctomycetaceae bacterium]|nr:aldose 1-epimerase [Planctomycetaceae bacterium]
MNIVEISNAQGSHAKIAVDLGFNCFSFTAHTESGAVVDVLSAADNFEAGGSPASRSGIPLLFPYPNRIKGGRYSWRGTQYQMAPHQVPFDSMGNAIHGFCSDRPWRVVAQSDSSVTAVFRTSVDAPDRLALWPADAEITVTYELSGSCLRSHIRVYNPSQESLPWGFGTHAYFRLPLSRATRAEECKIYAPASHIWELEQCLPTGRIQTPPAGSDLAASPLFGSLKLDDVYTKVAGTHGTVTCRITDPGAGLLVEQRFPEKFREIVAFTPPWTAAVCLEPYTCVTNAINLQQQNIDTGLQILPPGESWSGTIEIEVLSAT